MVNKTLKGEDTDWPLFSPGFCEGSVWFVLLCFCCLFHSDTAQCFSGEKETELSCGMRFLETDHVYWAIGFVATVRINHGLEKATQLKTELCV